MLRRYTFGERYWYRLLCFAAGVLPALITTCTVAVSLLSACDNQLSVEEAQRRLSCPLYLPKLLPPDIDTHPLVREYQDPVYTVAVHYFGQGQQIPVLDFNIRPDSSVQGQWPRDPYTSAIYQKIVRLPKGRLVGILRFGEYNCGSMVTVDGTPCIALRWPGEGAWYELYSLLPLSETLAVIESMEAVPRGNLER